ncbi:aminoglycoside phosphotransferase family protein [Flavihumibacter sp. R14]|nr:aminoglycoside phosphotransferase family protein [Flavihumibacter soli]
MIINEKYDLPEIVSQFQVKGTISVVKPHGSGHINDSFHLQNAQAGSPDYLLQRINSAIFKDVPGLMENIYKVITHLKSKLAEIPGSNPDNEVLTLVKTADSKFYYKDTQGNYWRMYHYLKDTRSFDVIEDNSLGYEGGRAFGRFQAQLIDLDINSLCETIPDFHNISKRVNDFKQAIASDPVGRKQHIQAEIDFLSSRAEHLIQLSRDVVEGATTKRITHNDTKFNNLLLDQMNRVQCVVDLDTVMPGYLAYDFGDAIRTLINSASEDEKDLDKIRLNIPLFESYIRGYLEQASEFITPEEVRSLSAGMLILPYMQSIRFLTDYLNGDTYYKIHFPEHNLQRSRAQTQLFRQIEGNLSELEEIIRKPVIVPST